jgi:hypothetical protein
MGKRHNKTQKLRKKDVLSIFSISASNIPLEQRLKNDFFKIRKSKKINLVSPKIRKKTIKKRRKKRKSKN